MFVIVLTYTQPLEAVDRLVPEHVQWLDRHYATGHFLASGRRVPRTGGVILAHGLDRAALDAALADDPFNRHGVARYEVIEFAPGKTAEALAFLQI